MIWLPSKAWGMIKSGLICVLCMFCISSLQCKTLKSWQSWGSLDYSRSRETWNGSDLWKKELFSLKGLNHQSILYIFCNVLSPFQCCTVNVSVRFWQKLVELQPETAPPAFATYTDAAQPRQNAVFCFGQRANIQNKSIKRIASIPCAVYVCLWNNPGPNQFCGCKKKIVRKIGSSKNTVKYQLGICFFYWPRCRNNLDTILMTHYLFFFHWFSFICLTLLFCFLYFFLFFFIYFFVK